MSGRVRKANRYLKRVMCQAAWAATHTKNSYLSAFYRRMAIRKGAPKAVMALAHHMIVVVHQLLSRGEQYVELGGDYYDQRNKPKMVARLAARLAKLGYEVELKPIEVAFTCDPAPAPPVLTANAEFAVGLPQPSNSKRKRGRPCKCSARGIICLHGRAEPLNSLNQQPSAPERFS